MRLSVCFNSFCGWLFLNEKIIMKEELIILAKEKGFNSLIDFIHENLKSPDMGELKELLYYLWLCELQKWLREAHNIHVFPKFYKTQCKYYFEAWNSETKERIDTLMKLTYEQALEEGLQEALKLIKG